MRAQHLGVFLLKGAVRRIEDAVKDAESLEVHTIRRGQGLDGRLFVAPQRLAPPSWVPFVASGVDADLSNLRNGSTSAVLICRVRRRHFALTFGYGRSLLVPNLIEPGFGLRVALNAVNPDKLRGVDARTFEDQMLNTRRQTSRASSVDVFGLDISRDLLRAVTGEPADQSFARRITGSDGLVIDSVIEFKDLGRLLGRLLEYREDTTYRKRFKWVDQLRPVRDESEIAGLDDRLLTLLCAGDTASVHLAVPEIIDYERGLEFGYSTAGRAHFVDLDLDEYLRSLEGELGELAPDDLRRHTVRVYEADSDHAQDRWPVYDCIVAEIRDRKSLLVLMGGQWFAIEGSLVKSVDAFLSGLPKPDLSLPPADPGEEEGEYNTRVAPKNGSLAILDRVPFRVEGAASPIEACDLFSTGGHFVHVKRKTRSASLSHLFAQGLVSAEAFLHDAGFRGKLHERLEKQGQRFAKLISTAAKPDTRKFTVLYAIIANHDRPLPFFSRLNLMQTSRRLGDIGYRVSLVRVDERGLPHGTR